MAIRNRYGSYEDFDATKLLGGEFADVQSGDPNTTDGRALYIAPVTGQAKRVAFAEEVEAVLVEAREIAEETVQEEISAVTPRVEGTKLIFGAST